MNLKVTRQQLSWLSVQLQKDYEKTIQERSKLVDYLAISDSIGYDPERLQSMMEESNNHLTFLKEFARIVVGL